jgi:hypothetical protein
LNTNQTDLAALGITLAGNEPLTGSLTAEIWGKGAVNDWRNGAAGARIDVLELNAADTQIRNEGQITLGYETEAVSANATLVSGDSRLHVEGSLPLRQTTTPSELRLEGDINLDTLAKLVPSEEPAVAQGRLRIGASLSGSFERLDPTLDLSIQQAGVEHPSLLAPLTNVSGEAQLEEGAMRLITSGSRMGRRHDLRLGSAAARAAAA